MTEQTEKPKISKKEAVDALWRLGRVCDLLLDINQKAIIKMYYERPTRKQVVVFPRQTGKTYCLLALATELCLNNKNFIILFIAPRKTQARKIAKTTMREILESCPPDLLPNYKTQENVFEFHNGSVIEMAGNNAGNIEDCRGPKAHLVICDEVGFWDDLAYSVNSVLFAKLNTTKGKLMMTSTPPKSAGHPFQSFYEEASFKKASLKRTIYDCPRYTDLEIEEFADELGGFESIEFRREYMSEFIVDSSMAVIPEATDELMGQIVREVPKPKFYDKYVAMDIGFKDLTFILFAYFDFRAGKVVVEDEIVINGPEMTTDKLAYLIYEKERLLWGEELNSDAIEPFLRVADTNLILLNDLYVNHGLIFQPTDKDDNAGSINNMRMMLNSERVLIHPRCKKLIFHVQNATWKDDKRKQYDRSPDAGHYDGVDALKYLLRNVQYHRNPFPAHYNLNLTSSTFISPHFKPEQSSFVEGIKNAFTKKKRKTTW